MKNECVCFCFAFQDAAEACAADWVWFVVQKAAMTFSPGAWRRSEVGVARSAAERAPGRTPGSESRSAASGEREENVTHLAVYSARV